MHTVNGRTLGENIAGASVYNDDVIRPLDNPVYGAGGLVVLRGNLAPRGAVLKRAAADPGCSSTTGPPSCFSNFEDMLERIDDPDLPVNADSVLVLQDAGPSARRACRNGACCRSRRSCSWQGVRDMVRFSDARMSGTSYGTCVLHVCPESRVGGPLGLVRDGDMISLDTAGRRLEPAGSGSGARLAAQGLGPPPPHYRAATARCTSPHMSCRRTKAATSISWRAPATYPTRKRGSPKRRACVCRVYAMGFTVAQPPFSDNSRQASMKASPSAPAAASGPTAARGSGAIPRRRAATSSAKSA